MRQVKDENAEINNLWKMQVKNARKKMVIKKEKSRSSTTEVLHQECSDTRSLLAEQ